MGKIIPVKRTLFFIDEREKHVGGYSHGQYWNGWACPMFGKDDAMKVIEHYSGGLNPARYDAESDCFIFIMDASGDKYFNDPPTFGEMYRGFDDRYEGIRDVYRGIDITVKVGGESSETTTLHVYAIGAGSWTWDDIADFDELEEDED